MKNNLICVNDESALQPCGAVPCTCGESTPIFKPLNIDYNLLQEQIDHASDLLSKIATPEQNTKHELALQGLIQIAEHLLYEYQLNNLKN